MGAFLSHCFLRCVIFICSFLIWIFIKKSLIGKRFYFWETFWFSWNLEVLKLTFKILRFWNFEDFDLKFGTWNLKFWDLGFWKLRLEILIMKFEVWIFFSFFLFFFSKTKEKFGHWECGTENFGNENFELKIWSLKDTWKLWKRICYFLLFFTELTQLLVEF